MMSKYRHLFGPTSGARFGRTRICYLLNYMGFCSAKISEAMTTCRGWWLYKIACSKNWFLESIEFSEGFLRGVVLAFWQAEAVPL